VDYLHTFYRRQKRRTGVSQPLKNERVRIVFAIGLYHKILCKGLSLSVNSRTTHNPYEASETSQILNTKMIRYATVFSFSLICVLLTPFSARAVTVPGGTSLMVRTVDPLSSSDKAGKSFAARLDDNLVVRGRIVIPAGSKVYGRIDSSKSAGRAFGQSQLALSLRKIVVDGHPVAIATGEFEESGTRSGRKTARRAAAGTLIGFALGGPAVGAAVGAATGLIGKGQSIEAPAGTLLEFRLARSVVL
jgi:hypothetical protein